MSLDWTQENAKELDGFLKSPTGEKWLMLAKLKTIVSTDSTPIPGLDPNAIASQAYAFHQGMASALKIIVDEFKPGAETKPLPPPFTPPKPK